MNDEELARLDKYLNGELPPAEVRKIEKRLAEEPAWQQELVLRRRQHDYLDYRSAGGITPDRLDELAGQYWATVDDDAPSDTKKSQPILRFLLPLMAAASITLLIWWSPWNSRTLNASEIYATQMTVPVLDLTSRNGTNTESNDSLYREAVLAFQQSDYARAQPLLAEYLASHTQDSELLLAYAVASIELDDYVQAEEALNQLAAGSSLLTIEVPFYRAMNELKQGRLEEAREIIDAASSGDRKLEELREVLSEG